LAVAWIHADALDRELVRLQSHELLFEELAHDNVEQAERQFRWRRGWHGGASSGEILPGQTARLQALGAGVHADEESPQVSSINNVATRLASGPMIANRSAANSSCDFGVRMAITTMRPAFHSDVRQKSSLAIRRRS